MSSARNSTDYLYLTSRVLCSPLEAMYTLLIFILCKDLNANFWQLSLLASLKPVVSLFAFYTSSLIVGRPHLLRKFLLGMNVIGCLPCILFPFADNVWFFVVSYAIFMTALRATFPAWNEILKQNLSMDRLGKTVSIGTSINYTFTIFVPLILSFWMDQHHQLWKTLFCGLAILQVLNAICLWFLQIKPSNGHDTAVSLESMKAIAVEPWKKGWNLLRNNPAFRKYQLLFFIGGAGLVALQPVLPVFFKENLHLSYTQLTLAFSLCKGLGFISTSFGWTHFTNRISLFVLNSVMNLLSCIFIVCLFAAEYDIQWIFFGYIAYGAMQAGCELSWNLSGPIFAKESESTLYSSVNLACVGIRGVICPFLGQLIFVSAGLTGIFTSAALFCFLGIFYGLWLDHESNTQLIHNPSC